MLDHHRSPKIHFKISCHNWKSHYGLFEPFLLYCHLEYLNGFPINCPLSHNLSLFDFIIYVTFIFIFPNYWRHDSTTFIKSLLRKIHPRSFTWISKQLRSNLQGKSKLGKMAWSGSLTPRPLIFAAHTSKIMLKILQARLQQYVNCEHPDVQSGFGKGRGTRDQIANICWIIKKAREFQNSSTFALLTMPKPLSVWITKN